MQWRKKALSAPSQEFKTEDVTIRRIATDRHTSISSAMDKEHKDTKHQFDVWHLSKWLFKKLTKKEKVKGCQYRTTSGGPHACNADVLWKKWKLVLHHITDKQKWTGYNHFQKKKWLKPDSPSYIALEEVVLNKKLPKDNERLTQFCHTGEVDVYHSEQLKYCPKRKHFSHKGKLARTQLTALDHNANAGQKQAVVQSGIHSGEAK